MHRSSPALIAKVMDLLLDAVCVVDREGRFVAVSAASEQIFGYRPEEMVGRAMIEFVHPEDRERTLQAAAGIMAGQPLPHFRNRYLRKDGETVHVMWSARWSEEEQVRIAVARDVTRLARAEALQAAIYAVSEAAYSAHDLLALFRQIHRVLVGLLPGSHVFIGLCDEQGSALNFPALPAEAGAEAQEQIGQTRCAQIVAHGAPLPAGLVAGELAVWAGVPLRSGTGIIGALLVQSVDEQPRYAAHEVDLLQFVAVQIGHAIERKQAELRIRHLALHDPLTGLPNRELFRDRLGSALRRAQRHGFRVALLYIDLDGFKPVNDRHGHDVGDRLLREVGVRLRACLREADTVARIGGDEFMVVLDGIEGEADAVQVAEKIRAALELPFALDACVVALSSSIGIALHPEHGLDDAALIRHADEAMYAAKAGGKNRVMLAEALLSALADPACTPRP